MLDIPTEDDDGNQANTASRTKAVAQEPQKPWMNDAEFDKLVDNVDSFTDAEDAVKKARTKYAVSKAMEANIRNLF
jgi:hypothetical protein